MEQRVTGWVGWVWFGAFALLSVGLFNLITGLIAVFDEDKLLAWSPANGAYVLDISTWGWVHLFLGILLTFTGFALFAAAGWARVVAIVAMLAAIVWNFFWLPVTPWWSLAIIVLGALVLWALTVHGDEVERAVR
ncbi:MAG: hypothetical protein NVV70_15750 [Cellulomonas sp.]|uniref:Membrane protein n=1 Tax=Cellulomonas gelida TaxID=1712 RepID=A0A4Y3KKN4_9CELL|nr:MULTISPECIES: hypothetical protein [Cellulomonas]KMM47040.1 membrane protein [Cellulomonas sp. A375-1]MCR6649511.1 hypothetical protein [Cellulomonas sp.]MCR6705480.1 hypothetical protein [Cellulomonas sp.]GEA84577.1 membrane protein [Cellulomonas gelida]GGL17629.1 membrane protein [Cellulomonas gelida]